MVKIFDASQIKRIDTCTIQNRKISSIDLMEDAALSVFHLLSRLLISEQKIIVLAGMGNNGGDALALARMLLGDGFHLQIYLVGDENCLSEDCKVNRDRLERIQRVQKISSSVEIPHFDQQSVIIDGLFGSGLNRQLKGVFADIVKAVNRSNAKVYSIDIPSGFYANDNTNNDMELVMSADHVFSFQFPKLSLLLPQERDCYKKMSVLDIGLCPDCIEKEPTDYFFIEKSDISNLLVSRSLFSHKGKYGYAFLIVGSRGKMGAAILAASACLRTGVGLLTVHSPECGLNILQNSIPEAMVDVDSDFEVVSNLKDIDLDKYTIGVGSGIGLHQLTKSMFSDLLDRYHQPMVIDADALNLLSSDNSLKEKVPPYSILTPHPVEFERLIGVECKSSYERLQYARSFSAKYKVYIVLKGAYTSIITPEGKVYFNSTGNPGMATAGSGDVLTGMITSLLAQKYKPLEASLIGVYLHGLSGDFGANLSSGESLLASDIVQNIGIAYRELKKS